MPIVEPEVLMDGDHDLDTCAEVTRRVLAEVCSRLVMASVDLRSMVLKPSMVIPGADGPPASVQRGGRGHRSLPPRHGPRQRARRGLPLRRPGSPVATAHLDAIARLGPHPWAVTFSYGRALQNDALRTWGGDSTNRTAAQEVLLLRSRCNGEAALGNYNRALETV